jgi:hypothetical protein
LSESAAEKDHKEEKVKKEYVPEITRFAVARERKEEHVNKERAQEILLSRIIVQNRFTCGKKEVIVQKDDESTYEEEDYSASEWVFFWATRLGDSQ